MTTILRNVLVCIALAVISYLITVYIAPEELDSYAPGFLPPYAGLAFAFSTLLSVGVFITSALLALVVNGRARWHWVLAYAALWGLFVLYLNFPANRQSIGFDRTTAWLVWPAVLAVASALLAARLVWLVRR